MDTDLHEVQSLLISLARRAGEMILAADPASDTSSTKQNSTDLVTVTDKAIESIIQAELAKAYPDFQFLGEESYQTGMQLSEAPTFVIDPIDGTTNFVHGFPYVATSLALVIGRVSMVGVIYNPFLDTLYSAIRGEGAFETKRGTQRKLPLTASPQPLTKLNKCIVTAEWGYGRTGVNFEARKHVFGALAADKEDGGATVHALRSIGSSALNLCAVAAGQQDVWWEGGPWAWDVAAGYCILREAGGKVVGGNPGVWDAPIDARLYLAIRPAPSGQDDIIEEFWGLMGSHRMVF